MEDIKSKIIEYANNLDRFLCLEQISGKTLEKWIEPLAEVISEGGAIPYLLGTKERFRASPLASSLIWARYANLFPDEVVAIMQEKLVFLRDYEEPNDSHLGNQHKKEEDNPGWSLSEGVSIWSTSMALIALLDSRRVNINNVNCYKSSIIWLVDQKKSSGGWAYQCIPNCQENTIMTALALRALLLAKKNQGLLCFDKKEEKDLDSAIYSGVRYLMDSIQFSRDKKSCYWFFNNEANCAATVWSLFSLKIAKDIGIDNAGSIESFYKKHLPKCLNFVLSQIPPKCKKWKDELIVCEAGAKYSKQKNYYSLSATLIPELLELGVSPYHPRIVYQIKWLMENEDQWKIENYDRSDICSFSYTMILSTIVRWRQLVGARHSKEMLCTGKGIRFAARKVITGIPYQGHQGGVFYVVNICRIMYWWVLSLLFGIMLTRVNTIQARVELFVNWVYEYFKLSGNSVLSGIISTAIYSAFLFLCTRLLGLFGKTWEKNHD